MDLLLDLQPMTTGGNPWVNGREVDLAKALVGRDNMVSKEVEHWRPIHAVGTRLVRNVPPMPHAGLLAILKVTMEPAEPLGHSAGLADGHIVVVSAVEDVNTFLQIIGFERKGVAHRHGPLE